MRAYNEVISPNGAREWVSAGVLNTAYGLVGLISSLVAKNSSPGAPIGGPQKLWAFYIQDLHSSSSSAHSGPTE